MIDRAPHYRHVLESLERLVARESEPGEILRETVELLHDRCDDCSWVGIYLVNGRDLLLGPWKGPQATEHVRIPIGQGICGAAAATGRTEIVDDVAADERYLACFPSTRSEIVVPVTHRGLVVAEIDVDSDSANAFTAADQAFLERVAAVISPYCLGGWETADG
jgi:GAF domain-containing protein